MGKRTGSSGKQVGGKTDENPVGELQPPDTKYHLQSGTYQKAFALYRIYRCPRVAAYQGAIAQ